MDRPCQIEVKDAILIEVNRMNVLFGQYDGGEWGKPAVNCRYCLRLLSIHMQQEDEAFVIEHGRQGPISSRVGEQNTPTSKQVKR